MLVEGRKGRIVTRNLIKIKYLLFEKESDFWSVIFYPRKNNVLSRRLYIVYLVK